MADRGALGPDLRHGAMIAASDAALSALARLLGHEFRDEALLERALIHPSAVRRPDAPTYQRLEFLGDAVLGLVISDMLYVTYPEASEGELSRRKANLVRGETCAAVAREIGLGGFVVLGEGEALSGGRTKEAILSDVCEAVIGALYLDGGYDAARPFIETHWRERMIQAAPRLKDAKTALQEWAHSRGLDTPEYVEVERSGPDHAPVFTIGVDIAGLERAQATGTSKRLAEQAAAEAMLIREGAWPREKRG